MMAGRQSLGAAARSITRAATSQPTAGAVSRPLSTSAAKEHSGTSFKGVFPIMATPFNPDETLDVPGFAKALKFMADAGANGATIVGVLGESNRLTDNERADLIEAAVGVSNDVDGDFPIVVGTSHAGTYATAQLTKMAQEMGAHGAMVTPTKEPTPATPAALHAYYAKVAEVNPGFPIVLQDHPASTQVHMSMELVHQISVDLPEVECIKSEALPSPAKIAQLRKLWEGTPAACGDCTILSGLGALYGGYELKAGIDGFMTGFAFPEILQAMVNNRLTTGDAIYQRFLPLIVFEQQPGVAVRKELYRIRGLVESGHVRHPGGNISPFAAGQLADACAAAFPGHDITKPIPLDAIDY